MKKEFISLLFFFISHCIYAEDFSSTNIQILYGNRFDNLVGGFVSVNKTMRTITIEHFGMWKFGNNFFFFDLTSGEFSDGKEHKIYGEWSPAISLSKTTRKNLSYFIFKDFLFVGQINQGSNFRANLVGMGISFKIPFIKIVGLAFYRRYTNVNEPTFQVTAHWQTSFNLGRCRFITEGIIDRFNEIEKEDRPYELIAQPRFLLDIGNFFNTPKTLEFGIEMWCYQFGKVSEYVPQVMLKWIW